MVTLSENTTESNLHPEGGCTHHAQQPQNSLLPYAEAAVGSKHHARWRANGKRGGGGPPPHDDRTLTATHRGSLRARGLTDETITQARLFSASPQQVSDLLGLNPSQSPGIVIPYIHPVTGIETMYRVRLDIPIRANGKEMRYLGARGIRPHFYFPPGWGTHLHSAKPIIATEGEFKALIAQQAGFPTIAIAGVNAFTTKNHEGRSEPIPDFELPTWTDRTVTIGFDNDILEKEPVQKAQTAFAHELYTRGVKTVLALDLPYTEGVKLGIDDFLNIFGRDAFLNVDQHEIPCPFPPVKVWSGADLIAADLPRPEPIVSGYGFRCGGKGMIVGAGGRGKSTLLLQMAGQLAAGVPLFRYGPLAVERPQRVAMYLPEDPLSETRFRFAEQCRELESTSESIARIQFLDFGGRRMSLDKDADRATLFRTIRDLQADVVMLDPLVAIHDADENNNPAMRKVLDSLNPLCEAGVSFLIAHHEPKNPENNSASSRGASAIRDWCRTMLRLTAHGKGELGSSRYSLDLDKYNYGGTVWNLTLERLQDSYIFTVAEDESKVTAQQVWSLIGPDERWFTEVLQEIVSKFSVSQSTAARSLKKAEELSLVIVGNRENPETGRAKKTITRGRGPEVSDDE